MSGELSSNSSNTESSDNTALRKELSSKEQRSSEWANKYRSRKGVGREGIPEITVHTYYKINFTNQLGQGASGRVFQAWRRSDGLPVAVKIMHQKLLADHDNRQALENEISILKELECDNIIKLYDTFEDRYNFYLVLELVTGGELFFRIEARQGYCELDGRELCRCILTALNYIHERGIVHRDIKPENLLMASKDDDVTVKLCDFGFSERVSGDSLTGSLGTPLYMAPEIWSGRNYGLAIDMWSFGCLAYIILCGYPPFYDTDLAVLYALVSRGELIFHEEFWGPVSAAAKDFVSRLLTVDPAQRMTAAQALQHPWLQVDRQTLRGRELPAKTQLRTFNARERIKQALTSVS